MLVMSAMSKMTSEHVRMSPISHAFSSYLGFQEDACNELQEVHEHH